MPPRKKLPLVVIDTNVIVSAARTPKTSAARDVVLLWKRGFLQLVLSDDIIREYLLVLARFDLTESQMKAWARWFVHPAKTIHLVSPRNVKESRDAKDDPFLGAAISGSADWIISRDDDLLVLNEFEGIPIVTPAEFMEQRRAEKNKARSDCRTASSKVL